MQRNPLGWILGAAAVLGVAALTFWLGQALLPSRTAAQAAGTIVPWCVTWGLVWMTVLISIIIAGNLFAVGLNSGRSDSIPALLPPANPRTRNLIQ
jgi:hypothetical protein